MFHSQFIVPALFVTSNLLGFTPIHTRIDYPGRRPLIPAGIRRILLPTAVLVANSRCSRTPAATTSVIISVV